MTQAPPRFFQRLSRRSWFAPLLCALAGACSSSSSSDGVISFSIAITSLDHSTNLDSVTLRCDHQSGTALSTLAVGVTVTSVPADEFVLRPANACGASTRCGYIRIQGLTAAGEVLAQVDTVTLEGVLDLPIARITELSKIEAIIINGVDQKPLPNPDHSAVTDSIQPQFVVPTGCMDEPVGGSGGAGGEAGAGGAFGGAPAGGAGGETPGASGAGLGGEADAGAAGQPSPVAGAGGA